MVLKILKYMYISWQKHFLQKNFDIRIALGTEKRDGRGVLQKAESLEKAFSLYPTKVIRKHPLSIQKIIKPFIP